MKIINFDTPAEKEIYTKIGVVGWALAVIDGDTIKRVHMLLNPAASVPKTTFQGINKNTKQKEFIEFILSNYSDGSIDGEATELLELAAEFIQANRHENIFLGMVSSYEFVDPHRVGLSNLASIGRLIGDALVQLEEF